MLYIYSLSFLPWLGYPVVCLFLIENLLSLFIYCIRLFILLFINVCLYLSWFYWCFSKFLRSVLGSFIFIFSCWYSFQLFNEFPWEQFYSYPLSFGCMLGLSLFSSLQYQFYFLLWQSWFKEEFLRTTWWKDFSPNFVIF